MTDAQVMAFAQQHKAPDDYLYLLVDGLAECDAEHALSVPSLRASLGDAAVERVLRPDLAHAPEACPALVQLTAPGEAADTRLLTRSAHYALEDAHYHKRYICGWLLSAHPLSTAAEHIAEQCLATSAGPGQPPSPWYEPLRLELLAAALGSQIGTVLHPIHTWLCPTSWGSLALLQGDADPAAPNEISPLARQTQRLAPLVSDLLGAWRAALKWPPKNTPQRGQGSGLLPPQAGAQAFRLVRDAQRLGLKNHQDILSLSLHRVFVHPLLPQHPDVQRDIATAAAGHQALQALFATYDDNTWQRMAATLPQAENSP